MLKKILAAIICGSVVLCGYAQAQSPKDIVTKAFVALQQKDAAQLQTYLANNCTMAGLDAKTTRTVLPQVVSKFAAFGQFAIVSDSTEGFNHRVKITLNYAQGTIGHPNVLTDASGRIIELNIIRDPRITQAAPNTWPAHVELPFQLVGNCIYTVGAINGRAGLFMIDSGAFGLIVNSELFPVSPQDSVNYAQKLGISGVNGRVNDARSVTVKELNVSGIKLNNSKLIAMPMEETAGDSGLPNLGLLGYDFLKNYELTFDYGKQLLTMDKADSTLKPTADSRIKQVSFEMQHHLPVVAAIINGKTYHFALDCGASHNIIFTDFGKTWQPLVKNTQTQPLSGIDGRVSSVTTATLNNMTIGGISFRDMSTAFSTNQLYSVSATAALKIDGILGAPFFAAYRLTLNYQQHQLGFHIAE